MKTLLLCLALVACTSCSYSSYRRGWKAGYLKCHEYHYTNCPTMHGDRMK